MSNFKSTTILAADGNTITKKSSNPAEIDDLGFFSTVKQAVVTPIKAGLKMTYLGATALDSVTSSLYENKEELDGVIRQGTRQGILLAKAGVIGVAKLNKEIGESMGVNLNDDIDVLIDQIYNEKEENK